MFSNPLLIDMLTPIIRALLMLLAGYLVKLGLWSSADADGFVTRLVLPVVIAVLTLGWALWEKYGGRIKLLVAMAATRPMTEQQVEAAVKNPSLANPPASTPKDAIPEVKPQL